MVDKGHEILFLLGKVILRVLGWEDIAAELEEKSHFLHVLFLIDEKEFLC